ncbi:MAG: AAA family ATPase, partial [Thermomicrobiales bacterium]
MINGSSNAYIKAAIEGEIAGLSCAPQGDRNNHLFKSAASLASLGLREGEIIHHLRPAAEFVGLRGKEVYATVKSGAKTGAATPRDLPTTQQSSRRTPGTQKTDGSHPLPERSTSRIDGTTPAFFHGGDEGPRIAADEMRRHIYRRDGAPVRVKIKRHDGSYVNWYRVAGETGDGWQSGKPDGYEPCPYVGAVNPFDQELKDDLIYWPEGEKDCETLGLKNFPAFTFGGTGDGLPDGVLEYVRNRHVVVLADNDASGRKHAARKVELAQRAAASIKVVGFEDLPAGGDVSDFLKANSAETLQERVDQTPFWRESERKNSAGGESLVACSLSDVAPEKIEWLWPGRIAVGKITMIGGEPGLGKSQVSIAIASAVTTSGYWPLGNDRAPLGSVIILSAEDGLADTVRPRFDAAGGDASRVRIIRAVQTGEGAQGRRTFNLAHDLALLEAEIQRCGDARLVLIDPVSSYLGKTDSHKNADVRGVLEPLGDMAERLRVAIVAITHLSKGDGKAINRFIGSIAFVAAARTAFAVVADKDDESGSRRLLLPVKNNIAVKPDGLAFRLAQRLVSEDVIGSHVVWDESAPVLVSVDDALTANGSERTATAEAVDILRDILSAGPMNVLDIDA